MTGSSGEALVIACHGSQHTPMASRPAHDHAERIRRRGGFDSVGVACWKEEPTLREAVRSATAERVFVVPLLTSEGYFADRVFPRELGVDRPRSNPRGPDIRYTAPIGTHERMTEVILDRADRVTGPAGASHDIGLALVGHGTDRSPTSAAATRDHAEVIRRSDRFAAVGAFFLDQSPTVETVYDSLGVDAVVVVPFFVADGTHTTEDIPAALGLDGPGGSRRRRAVVDGTTVWYAGAVGTDPRIADVIIERAVEAGASPDPDRPSIDGPPAAGRAFLERLDRSADEGLTWGQLVIEPRTDGGYTVCHRADGDRPEADLQRLGAAAAVRGHLRFDDDGRYRPLTGARSLPTGWVATPADGRELVRIVEAAYPGSIPAWHRERTDALEVTHFGRTAARQSGRYASLESLSASELDGTVGAVCGGCVRDRRWGHTATDPVDAADGGGRIPCEEACPVLLEAAARTTSAGAGEASASTAADADGSESLPAAVPRPFDGVAGR